MAQLTAAQAKKINKDSLANSAKELGGIGLGDRVRTLESGTTYVTGTEAQIGVCGTDGVAVAKTMSGDATIDKDGVLTVGANKIGYEELDATSRTYVLTMRHAVAEAAAATLFDKVIAHVPFAGTVKYAKYTADAAFGQDTNFAALAVINKGHTDGTGTTAVATNNFDVAGAATAYVPKALTLNATPANLAVAAGDVLTLAKTKTGDGQLVSTGVIEVVIERTA